LTLDEIFNGYYTTKGTVWHVYNIWRIQLEAIHQTLTFSSFRISGRFIGFTKVSLLTISYLMAHYGCNWRSFLLWFLHWIAMPLLM
jgi:hypothetical protein